MSKVKTDNFFHGVNAGYYTRWVHNDGGKTTTITPNTQNTTNVAEPIVLDSIVVNTTSASAIIVSDSAVGVIAVIKASVVEQTFVYNLPLKGNLVVQNPGASDITIVFTNY